MDISEKALESHKKWAGKIEISARADVKTKEDLSLAYTPGVAAPCLEIQKDVNLSYTYTRRANTVAVVTDGTAVLGLGDIGAEAAMPVMEGKCLLFKEFGDVDAWPLCIKSKNVDEIVRTISLLSGSFGGINLEDISAPRCFEIERKLKECCDIPIFHDDQHGTAIVLLAAMINALKVVKKHKKDVSVVVLGAGSAGIAITKLLLSAGIGDVILCDKNGAICKNSHGLNSEQILMTDITNKLQKSGELKDIIVGTDVFVGVACANCLTADMVKSMANNSIVFAMSNPNPEIMPNEALLAGAKIVGTGRSDFVNQINNVLAFPGVFRGALDVRASDINDAMKLAAAHAIANLINADELNENYIIPSPFDTRVVHAVSQAVKNAAYESKVARI